MNILETIKSGEFPIVPHPTMCGGTFKFYQTDSEEAFKVNKGGEDMDSYFTADNVTYNLNSRGYRTKEFNEIDWNESIIVFGDSIAAGVGLDESQTLTSVLTELTGIPAVNMGVGGGSMMIDLHNASIIKDKCKLPKAVVNLWTMYWRFTLYEKNKFTNIGPWNMYDYELGKAWAQEDYNAKVYGYYIANLNRQLWKGTKHFEASFIPKASEALDVTHLQKVDWARDKVHPGRQSIRNIAQDIVKVLDL